MQEPKDARYEITEAEAALVQSLRQITQPITDGWIATAEGRGLEDPQAIVDEYRASYSGT